MLTLAVHDFDVTSGGGTGGLWWTVVVHVYCGVDEQLVSWDAGQKRKILKRGCPSSAGSPATSPSGNSSTRPGLDSSWRQLYSGTVGSVAVSGS